MPRRVFAVTDEGEGIAKEHLGKLTERFYRVDRARSRQTLALDWVWLSSNMRSVTTIRNLRWRVSWARGAALALSYLPAWWCARDNDWEVTLGGAVAKAAVFL